MKNIQFDENLTMQELLQKIQLHILANQDTKTKEVGDRVQVWDGSYSKGISTNKHYCGLDMEDHVCIVQSIDQKHIAENDLIGRDYTHVLDLIVFSPKYNELIRTSSEFIRVLM